jgi:CBS domain-containing protein
VLGNGGSSAENGSRQIGVREDEMTERVVTAPRSGAGVPANDRPRIAQDLMTSPVVSVSPTASVAEAARLMREHRLGWLAVVGATDTAAVRLVGVLGRRDLPTVFARDDGELR